MTSAKQIVKAVVRIFPAGFRHKLVMRFPGSRLVRFYSKRIVGRANMYAERFIEDNRSDENVQNAVLFAREICEVFNPGSIIDVGCGAGNLLQAFYAQGVAVLGMDFSDAAGREVREKGLRFVKVDLTSDAQMADVSETADVVTCFEVAEHLDKERARALVLFLCRLAPVVCFTAAPPGQGGILHVNEQLPEYWVKLFAASGYCRSLQNEKHMTAVWIEEGIKDPRVRNYMIFERER